jgi:hypothetical protein
MGAEYNDRIARPIALDAEYDAHLGGAGSRFAKVSQAIFLSPRRSHKHIMNTGGMSILLIPPLPQFPPRFLTHFPTLFTTVLLRNWTSDLLFTNWRGTYSDDLTPQETTGQDSGKVGAGLSCPGSNDNR